jgi:hypothetical protein
MWNASVNAICARAHPTGFTARIAPIAPFTDPSFRQNGTTVVTHPG